MDQLDKDLARSYFFHYCYITAKDFYKPDRDYLVSLCDELQGFLHDGEHDVLVINEPPRHGKSRTAGKFVEWLLGNDKTKKIMTGSYNETLSTVFSKNVRNTIQEFKADEDRIVFKDIFSATSIKQGDGAMNLWSLDGGYNNYLATSPTGTATGFGADIIIIDDLIKNAEEANNATVLEKHWEWFVNTMLSRLETGGKIIIIMTRWHSNDLAGKALSELPKSGYRVKHVSMKAYNEETKRMLCEDVLTYDEYKRKTKTMGFDIASANYQQEPIDIKGRLYSDGFKEYEASDMPEIVHVYSYTDTADEGDDNHMMYVFGQTADNQAYILDILYSIENQSITRDETVEILNRNEVNTAWFESNNGGSGYARNVQEKMKQKYRTNQTVIKWFHQSKNKKSRILTNATWAMENIFFPKGWKHKWPRLYQDLMSYQKQGKNKHDDAQDGLTGIAEICANKLQTTKQQREKNYQRIKRLF